MVARDAVLRWEDRRITAAAKKLGVRAPSSGDVSDRREAFLWEKLALGTDEIHRRLRREAALAGAVAKAEARLSRRRRFSVTDLYVPAGSAARFVEFYWDLVRRNDEVELLRAHPDHFVQRIGPDGRHEVLETNGGSPLAAWFFIDYEDLSKVVTPVDPAFPGQLAGVAYADGVAVGAVRHQFRDTDGGFHARLVVEFPLLTLGHMVAGHRWHLACEFSNWIEAAHN
ncbi:hypothetical protein [Mycobacterium sp. shizuoka-1]|uniref:hypothetical protein n=1 Tax=Mycobacterium sp. shizuoka-1 TaxID=2039281 RepID=UPI000C065C47|nr:hypothetical protein [Mycobacterium sp. shizuoka-1]GAY15156.1 hypothetical protein MSZK_18820 [Mycobacterium sp. shizuoka-1]